MRKSGLAILLTIASLAGGGELRIDHVTVAGRDLKDLRAKFAAAGVPTVYGGKHTNGLTEMALASFADGSYLELIAAQAPAAGAPGHYWQKFIDENAGPCAWAIRSDNIRADAERLGGHLTQGGRKRFDGVELKWTSAAVGPGAQGTFFPFLIQDITARDLRAYPQGKPTLPSEAGVAFVIIGVHDLDEAVARYRKGFDLGEPERYRDAVLGAKMARFPRTPVVLAAPDGPWLEARLRKFGEAPCAFVLRGDGAGQITWLPIEGMRIGITRGAQTVH